ncbi:MAG TPA: c-type cytochrome [Terriglobales bacterium]|nr:c-type cytochrome [Terriglobales bacterium]
MPPKVFIVVTMLSLLMACIKTPEPAEQLSLSPLEKKGLQVFQREPCYSACHVTTLASPETSNTAGFVPDLRKTPRRTRDWYLAYFVDPRAVLPYSFMPSFAHLSPADVDALIAFLQQLNRGVKVIQPEPVASSEIPAAPRNFANYRAGQALYRTYCAGCHGVSGNGGGTVGHLLSPEPRDFTDGAWMSKQTENYLFAVITVGKPNTAMPGFKDILTPMERALALRYVETFANPVERERLELGTALKGKP